MNGFIQLLKNCTTIHYLYGTDQIFCRNTRSRFVFLSSLLIQVCQHSFHQTEERGNILLCILYHTQLWKHISYVGTKYVISLFNQCFLSIEMIWFICYLQLVGFTWSIFSVKFLFLFSCLGLSFPYSFFVHIDSLIIFLSSLW